VTDASALARLAALSLPPAWRDVWASPDPAARVQATGVDARGRTQYRYSTEAEQRASDHKFSELLLFGAALPELRTRVEQHLAAGADDATQAVRRATAAAVRLIDRGLFRVGTDRYARDNHTYGLTTLTPEHVRVSGAAIEFAFIGKEHRPWHVVVDDEAVARVLERLIADAPRPDAPLFSVEAGGGLYVVGSAAVNAYIHGATTAPATAKTFRTWGGTAAAAAVTAGAVPPGAVPPGGTRSARADLRAYDAAAELLGNTREVARRSYVHPSAIEAGRAAAVVAAVEALAAAGSADLRTALGDDALVAAVVTELERLTATGTPTATATATSPPPSEV
jgi:DNA topoisomerase-1